MMGSRHGCVLYTHTPNIYAYYIEEPRVVCCYGCAMHVQKRDEMRFHFEYLIIRWEMVWMKRKKYFSFCECDMAKSCGQVSIILGTITLFYQEKPVTKVTYSLYADTFCVYPCNGAWPMCVKNVFR